MEFTDLSDEALAGLEQKLTRDLEMVRRVRAMLAEYRQGTKPAAPAPATANAPATHIAPAPVSPDAPAPIPPDFSFETPRMVLKDMKTKVLEAAAELGKPFRLREIMAATDARDQRSTVRSALNRLMASGEVVIVSRGMGQGGHLYQLKPTLPPSAGGMAEPAAPVVETGSTALELKKGA